MESKGAVRDDGSVVALAGSDRVPDDGDHETRLLSVGSDGFQGHEMAVSRAHERLDIVEEELAFRNPATGCRRILAIARALAGSA